MNAAFGESRGLLGWLLPLSVLAHVAIVRAIPAARSLGPSARPPVVVEMTTAPPEPKPPEPPPEPTPPTATPTAATPVPSTRATKLAPAATASAPSATEERAIADAPVDFTSTSFSSEGRGVAIGGPGRSVAAPVTAQPTAKAASEVLPFVPVGSLARAPSAPGLDAELERNYPLEARRSGVSGLAVLRVQILPDGRVGRVARVSESFAGFGEACTRTVRAGKWQAPIDHDGRAVSTEITYTCRFEVRS